MIGPKLGQILHSHGVPLKRVCYRGATLSIRGQTDSERYTWMGATYSLPNTKHSLQNKKNYVFFKGICQQERDSISYALLTWSIYCISGLSQRLGGYFFQQRGYYRILYALPLLLTNVLLKGHIIPFGKECQVFGISICCPFRIYCLAPYTVPLDPTVQCTILFLN